MESFFTTDFMATEYDSSLSSSPQGQLASTYTAALTEALMDAQAADFIGFLAFTQNGLTVENAVAVREAVEAGFFKLTDLFGAAQAKGAATADPNDPEPKLVVTLEDGTEVTIDLTAMLSGLDTEVWQTIARAGKTTEVINHFREFYTSITEPDGYDGNWDEANAPPIAEAIEVAVTEQDDKANPGGTDPVVEVNLLDPAKVSDPDGDPLSIVGGSVTLSNGDALPSYVLLDGNTLKIDPNSPELEVLQKDELLALTVSYVITDGKGGFADNTVEITVTGTADKFSGSTSYSTTWTKSGENYDQTLVDVPLTAPDGAFDFSGTAAITVTGDLDRNTESITISFEGGEVFTYTGTATSGNAGEGSNGAATWITANGSKTFASPDDELQVSYLPTDPVNTGGSITLNLTYDYWI